MNTKLLIAFFLSLATPIAIAQELELEEIIITGTASDGIPGTSLKRQGDYIHLQVKVSNDARDDKTRKDEIFATLKAMLAAAAKDKSIELSVIGENNFVLPLKLDSATVHLHNGKRPDTSETTISVKTRIAQSRDGASSLVAKLKDFTSNIKPFGRTLLDAEGDIEISIVNPSQYRDQVLSLFAADVKKMTAALGGDYKVVATNVDRQVKWTRSGMLDVTIYVPYSYVVLPATVTSFSGLPHGDY